MRYFIIRDLNTLEVFLSEELDKQPENSLPFYPNSLRKAIFDKYPNPSILKEGYIEEEIDNSPEQVVVNDIYKILEQSNLQGVTLVDDKGNPILPTE